MKRGLLLFVVVIAAAGLALAMGSKQAKEKKVHTADSTVTHQGIAGRVEIWEGNFMPMVDSTKAKRQITPAVGRRVRAYMPVKVDGLAAARQDTIATPMVAEAVTDSSGRFFMVTPAGLFSVFVEDNGGWYANGWNGDGVQGAVKVDSAQISYITIKNTTKATF